MIRKNERREAGHTRRSRRWLAPTPVLAAAVALALCAGVAAAGHKHKHDDKDDRDVQERPLDVAEIIIEVTDNDIELQVFVDDARWTELEISDPRGREIFELETKRRLGRQGMTEMGFASNPDHFPEEEPAPSAGADEVVRQFLRRFPAGNYEMEADTLDPNVELVSRARLTHVLAALPEIIAPVSDDEDELPVVDPFNAIIAWEPVTTRFIGTGPIEIIGYQVIVEQVEPFRKLVINLPGSATSSSVPPEFLEPGRLYDFELVAFEESGNATISVGEFLTAE